MALIDLNDPKLEFFNFGLEQKLDRHSCLEFHSDSYCDGFNFPKPQLKPPTCPLGAPKNAIFSFGLEQKLGHHFRAKFHSDSDGDGFKAQRPIIDLLIGSNRPK